MILPYTWYTAPGAETDIEFDATPSLATGDSLTTATATVLDTAAEEVEGMITVGPTVASPKVALRVAAGAVVGTYHIELTAETASGQTIRATLRVIVEESAEMARFLPRVYSSPAVLPEHADFVRELVRQAQAAVLGYTRVDPAEWPAEPDTILDAATVALTTRAYNQLGAEGASSVSIPQGLSAAWADLDPATAALLDRRRRLW